MILCDSVHEKTYYKQNLRGAALKMAKVVELFFFFTLNKNDEKSNIL